MLLTLLLMLVIADALPDAVPDALPDAVVAKAAEVRRSTSPTTKPITKPILTNLVLPDPLAKVRTGGHYERRCGPNGCEPVWVPDPPEAQEPDADISPDHAVSSKTHYYTRKRKRRG